MRGLLLPEPADDFTADPVELFFDLAFVLAFSRLVSHLVHHPTWTGAGEALLLFLILWFAWSVFTWAANAVQGNHRSVRALFLVATATSVPMGAAISSAFGSGGRTFGICASIIILMALGLQLWGNDQDSAEYQSVMRFATPNLVGMALLVGGGFATGPTRSILWMLFILTVAISMIVAGNDDWTVRSGHFAERHGLIMIIALGEVIVAIGISVVESLDDSGLPNETLFGLIAAGILAVLLWWSYFDRVLPALEHHAEGLTGRAQGHFARDAYTALHAPIVGGIIAAAAATEEILLHPKDQVPTEFLVMLVGGLTLLYLGVAGAAYRAFRAVAKERIAAIIVIALVSFLASGLDGVTLLFVIDAILLISLVAEHFRVEGPREPSDETSPAPDVQAAST